jgi:hypothetical protein
MDDERAGVEKQTALLKGACSCLCWLAWAAGHARPAADERLLGGAKKEGSLAPRPGGAQEASRSDPAGGGRARGRATSPSLVSD